jgi:hypothetical protein
MDGNTSTVVTRKTLSYISPRSVGAAATLETPMTNLPLPGTGTLKAPSNLRYRSAPKANAQWVGSRPWSRFVAFTPPESGSRANGNLPTRPYHGQAPFEQALR